MLSNVSVIIPAYGDSPHLNDTLQSISNNSIKPQEVLIIDDGLGESVTKNLDSLNFELATKVIRNDGRGLVDALNTGLRSASFKYICRIDNDDLMTPKRIETQLNFLKSTNGVVAVGSQCFFIDSSGKITGNSSYPVGNVTTLKAFNYKCLVAHPSTMYLKDSALSIGGYRSVFRWKQTDIAEDFDFWLRLASCGDIYNLDLPLTSYRQHVNQISSLYGDAQILGTAYVSAINQPKNRNLKSETIDFPNGLSSDGLTRLYAALAESPSKLHQTITHLQIQNYLSRVSNTKFNSILHSRIIIRIFNLMFRLKLRYWR
jgi:glycosyltransferase involved in cell wall biosynthesis